MELIEFNGKKYPAWQASGNASRFCMPFALEVCKGTGLDIGYSKPEWKLPGAIGIEPSIDFSNDAMNLPEGQFDYIFSSHMVEHFKGNWSELLDYWTTKIKSGGHLFLYLPDMDYQEYWRGWNNKKHIHYLNLTIMEEYFADRKDVWSVVVTAGTDPNFSFYVIAEKI